ncbi:MAG: DUF2177 family protein [Caulobacteraceae bacterium]
MLKILAAYGGTAVALAVIDAVWLSQMGPKLYKPVIGELLAPKPAWVPAVLFYLIFVGGLVYFAVLPAVKAGEWTKALVSGAVLGFVAYATYDLTNQATLKVWSTKITVIDLAWGTLLAGVASLAGYFAVRMVSR